MRGGLMDFPKVQCMFFSETAARLYGSNFYFTDLGREVEVTAVLHTSTPENYHFDDTVFVGRMGKHVWVGRKGSRGGRRFLGL